MTTIATSAEATAAVGRERLFSFLVPGVFGDELETILDDTLGVPGVTGTSDTSGPWTVPGSQRVLHFSDGHRAAEVLTASEPPDYFAYTVFDMSNPLSRRLVREVREEWRFTDDGAGTHYRWTATFEPKSVLFVPLLLPVVKVLFRRWMRAGVRAVKERAERELEGAA